MFRAPVTLAAVFAAFFAFSTLTAQTRDPGVFYGFWEMEEPAGDTCVINVKRGNRISGFFTGTASSEIIKGTWERQDTKLVVTWESGHVDIFTPMGTGALAREAYAPGDDLSGKPSYETRAMRVDSRVPGSLGVDPSPASEKKPEETVVFAPPPKETPKTANTTDIPIRNDFNGFWKIQQGSGGFLGIGSSNSEVFYLRLQRNGTAEVSLRRWDPGNSVTGRWTLEGNAAVIEWPQGQRDILQQSENSFSLLAYDRGSKLDRKPDRVLTVERSSPTEANQFFADAEMRFFSLNDVRGVWIPRDAKNPTDNYLFVEGWGHAKRHPAVAGGNGAGEWKMFHDRLVITWSDGSKSILRTNNRGWVEETIPPGASATSTPTATRYIRRVADNLQGLSSSSGSAQ